MNLFSHSFHHIVFVPATAALLLVVSCSSPTGTVGLGSGPTDDSSQVIAAAKRDFVAYLSRIPKGRETEYGFADRSEFDRVEVGLPLRVHTVDIDNTGLKPRAIQKLRRLDQWRIPLTVDGKQRALLTVVKKGDRFETADFGAAGLAQSLDNLSATLGTSKLNTPYLVRVFALRQDFLGVPTNDHGDSGDRFYPASPGLNESNSLPASSIVAAPTLIGAPLSRSDLFSLIDEHAYGGAK
jgi:hypothetical protein